MQIGQIAVTHCMELVLLYVRSLPYAGTYHSNTLCDTGKAVCKPTLDSGGESSL